MDYCGQVQFWLQQLLNALMNERIIFFIFFPLLFEGSLRWKEGLQQKASDAFLRQQQVAPNLRKLVYASGKVKMFYL